MAQKKTDVARYDRQIRLWGEEGQELLQHAHLCLLNANATGTETLKNLVLPGIGFYTIVDEKKVSQADLGSNFFVTVDELGKSRAHVTCNLLQELNNSEGGDTFAPQGNFVEKNPETIVESDIEFFSQFTLIIVTELSEKNLLKLAKHCWSKDIPLLIVKSLGYLGYLRIVVPEHTVIQSKPDNPPDDLRLNEPWKELSDHAFSYDFSNLERSEHSHVPFIVILIQHIRKWKKEHEGKLPQTYQEKSDFKKGILQEKVVEGEENFNEAYRAAHKAYTLTDVPETVRRILDDPHCEVNAESKLFWFVVRAIKEFVYNEGNGFLPLAGSLPDMTSTTTNYVTLQKIYHDKAMEDFYAVLRKLKELLRKSGKKEDLISEDTVKIFCKNARFLNVFRYRSLEEEFSALSKDACNLLKENNSNILWYILFRSVSKFQNRYGRYPGVSAENMKEDLIELKSFADVLLKSVDAQMDDKYFKEMVRYGGAELHNMASLMGGIASQEVIKIITHQYVPLNNTLIVNGIFSTSLSFVA